MSEAGVNGTGKGPGIHGREEYVRHLDGWRGVAIVLLLAGHFFPVPGINLGTVGVTFFFVLSGLLMGRVLFVKRAPLVTFYKRRVSRILPAHLVFIGGISAWWIVSERPASLSESVLAATFINNYFPGDIGANLMPFGHIWSLAVEEHSYVALALIAAWSRRGAVEDLRLMMSALLICVAVTVCYATLLTGPALYAASLRTEVAAIGVLAAALLVCIDRAGSRLVPPPALWAVALLVALALYWWSVPTFLRLVAAPVLLAWLVCRLDHALTAVRQFLSALPLCWLGGRSYSLYLWQQPFYLEVKADHLTPIVGLGFALLAGLFSYYLVESPARAYLNRTWAR